MVVSGCLGSIFKKERTRWCMIKVGKMCMDIGKMYFSESFHKHLKSIDDNILWKVKKRGGNWQSW